MIKNETKQDFFFIRMDKKNVRVNFQDILYLEASKNYIQIVTRTKSYMVLLSLRQMEEILPASAFFRVHRSYIVSLNYVTAFDCSYVHIGDRIIPVGDQYKTILREKVLVIYSDVRKLPAMATFSSFEIMATGN